MNEKVVQIMEYMNRNIYFKSIKNIEILSEKMVIAYPGTPILDELIKADLWLSVHPEKHYKKYDKFLVNWLNRAFGRTQWKTRF
jgi:hypothetical protein